MSSAQQITAETDAVGITVPEVPRGADPLTYRSAEVERSMRSAYFALFSVPNPATPDVPIPAKLPFPLSLLQRIPALQDAFLSAVEVNEAPLRFKTTVSENACQLLATNQVGRPVATVHIRWTTIPWDYPANPHSNPPQTIVNPFESQRFEMLNGEFRFDDSKNTGVHGFGAGRTFPNFPNGLSLNIGAVIDVLEGFGELRGHSGLMVVNGVITPPNELALNIMMRIIDPSGNLLATAPLPPLQEQPFPDPGATFMMFMAQPDPQRPSTLVLGPDRSVRGIQLYELLRAVDMDFDVFKQKGIKSEVRLGPIVGRASSMLHFPLSDPEVPIPAQTTRSEFHFFDAPRNLVFGTLRADLVEGRGFPTPVPGAPSPMYRIGGFGPIQGGTGEFKGARGLLSMNSLLSVFPRTFSNLYIFRFIDPDGRLRPVPGSTGTGSTGAPGRETKVAP